MFLISYKTQIHFQFIPQPEDRELFSEHHSDPTVNFYLDKISQKTNDFKGTLYYVPGT